jgi:long-subunit acyl-CoA synthetase (AMP-forming)
VPLYDSVGSDAVRYIVNHASLPLVFCERSKLPTLLEAAKESRSLKHTFSKVLYIVTLHSKRSKALNLQNFREALCAVGSQSDG